MTCTPYNIYFVDSYGPALCLITCLPVYLTAHVGKDELLRRAPAKAFSGSYQLHCFTLPVFLFSHPQSDPALTVPAIPDWDGHLIPHRDS